MQFVERDGRHEVIHIPGRSHNLLRLQFGDAPCDAPSVEAFELPSGKGARRLTTEKVLEHALAGVRAASEELGREIHVTRLSYVVGDSPPESRYEHLALRLALHVFGDA